MSDPQKSANKSWFVAIGTYAISVFILTTLIIFALGFYPHDRILISNFINLPFSISLAVVPGFLSIIGVMPSRASWRIATTSILTFLFALINFSLFDGASNYIQLRFEVAGTIATAGALAALLVELSPIHYLLLWNKATTSQDKKINATVAILFLAISGLLLIFNPSGAKAQGIAASNKDWSIAVLSDPNPKALAEKVAEWRMKNPGILLSVEHTSKPYSNSTSGPSGENAYIYFIPCPEARKYRTDAC